MWFELRLLDARMFEDGGDGDASRGRDQLYTIGRRLQRIPSLLADIFGCRIAAAQERVRGAALLSMICVCSYEILFGPKS